MRSTPIELAVATVLGAALLPSCAGSGKSDDLGQIVRVVRSARDDVVAGHARAACSKLTGHGRQVALRFNVEFDQEGTIPPASPRLPHTCEALVARMRARAQEDARNPMIGGTTWLEDAPKVRFELVSFDGSKAEVRARVRLSKATIVLRKTDAGWRIDDADFVPFGH